uniref:Uncharacterized protein n=1 Tax=Timema bartmani TaxID=61472 RepID=A0A7R9I8Z2_9NEOP|nr:unnamed protein product [Timema bartmani]
MEFFSGLIEIFLTSVMLDQSHSVNRKPVLQQNHKLLSKNSMRSQAQKHFLLLAHCGDTCLCWKYESTEVFHPAYSPNMSLPDFDMFPKLKDPMWVVNSVATSTEHSYCLHVLSWQPQARIHEVINSIGEHPSRNNT